MGRGGVLLVACMCPGIVLLGRGEQGAKGDSDGAGVQEVRRGAGPRHREDWTRGGGRGWESTAPLAMGGGCFGGPRTDSQTCPATEPQKNTHPPKLKNPLPSPPPPPRAKGGGVVGLEVGLRRTEGGAICNGCPINRL